MNIQRTIKKVLDELAKDKPDLSYIRGLLEGLVDDTDYDIKLNNPVILNPITYTTTASAIEPGPIKTLSRIEAIKSLADNEHVDEEIPASLRPGPIGNLNS